jgi:hypothetical protein
MLPVSSKQATDNNKTYNIAQLLLVDASCLSMLVAAMSVEHPTCLEDSKCDGGNGKG